MTRILALIGCFALSLAATELVVDADSTTRSGTPAQNFGALPQLQVDGTAKSFIRFSLSPVPSGLANQLVNATLQLYVNRVVTPGVILVGTANGQWTEAGVNEANAPGIVPLAEVYLSQPMGWASVEVTSAVKAWLNGQPNDGFVLTSLTAAAMFDSKESVSTSQPARLVLTFAGPQGLRGVTGLTGSPGQTGPAGATGAPGPSSLTGMLETVRDETVLLSSTRGIRAVSCPASHPNLVNGGCGHRDFNSAADDLNIHFSGPEGSGWKCILTNRNANASRIVVVLANCSK